jgi:hypothetical protein
MEFERWTLKACLLVLLITLILGGRPWKFPVNGKYWMETEFGTQADSQD